eukprot:COSAG01_NODE_1645_length_9639_cov_14.725786_8_plen_106_part_00
MFPTAQTQALLEVVWGGMHRLIRGGRRITHASVADALRHVAARNLCCGRLHPRIASQVLAKLELHHLVHLAVTLQHVRVCKEHRLLAADVGAFDAPAEPDWCPRR